MLCFKDRMFEALAIEATLVGENGLKGNCDDNRITANEFVLIEGVRDTDGCHDFS